MSFRLLLGKSLFDQGLAKFHQSELVLSGFVAAVLGGMGSSAGALLGGIILGITGKLVGGYISTAAEHGIAFALLVLMLAIRPQGFFGRAEVSKA